MAHQYPSVFRVERVHDSGGLGCGDSIVGQNGGRVKSIQIIPTGDKWDLDHEDPMTVAGLLADDLAVMIEGSDGLYYMQAGSICVPGRPCLATCHAGVLEITSVHRFMEIGG